MSKKKPPIDDRCPLKTNPEQWCPLAVMRLKAIRTAGRELTEEEESKLPGCPWAINHQLANYCFFKYIQEFGEGSQSSETEIAALLQVAPDTVKKLEKSALAKMREHKEFKEIKEGLDDGESVLSERLTDEDSSIYV